MLSLIWLMHFPLSDVVVQNIMGYSGFPDLKRLKAWKYTFLQSFKHVSCEMIHGVGVGILRSYIYIVGPFQTHSLTITTGCTVPVCNAYMIGSNMIIRSSPCAILVYLNTQNIKGYSDFIRLIAQKQAFLQNFKHVSWEMISRGGVGILQSDIKECWPA